MDSCALGEASHLAEQLEADEKSVLVLAPSLHPAERTVCRSLLSNAMDATAYFRVSSRRSVSDQATEYQRHDGILPDQAVFAQLRRGAGVLSDPAAQVPDELPIDVRLITDPGSLSKLGMALTDVVDATRDPDERFLVCFDSLTTVLQYTSVEELVQFVQTANEYVRGNNAQIHYHLDPNAHSEETVATFTHLVDAVVRVNDDDAIAIAH